VFDLDSAVTGSARLSPRRQQLADSQLIEAIINQVDHAFVSDREDDSAGGLYDLL
jgi:hypothetical protein